MWFWGGWIVHEIMADGDSYLTVEMLDARPGWTVVYRAPGMPPNIIGVYPTRAHAELAAHRLRKAATQGNMAARSFIGFVPRT
jgi:hypothetical protein